MTHLPTEDETPVPGELLLYTSPDGNIRLDLRIHVVDDPADDGRAVSDK